VIAPDATLREIAFAIGTALDREGIRAVLCGGSAATFYAPDAYQSEDLDFVLSFGTEGRAVRKVLAKLGYRSEGGLFVHDASHFTVEFPPGPLSIGAEPVERVETICDEASVLHVISATDAVRDRLHKFAVWDDFSALRAAVAVALQAAVNLDAVRAFMQREGGGIHRARFEQSLNVFERRLREGRP
jgi:hypothetical protein